MGIIITGLIIRVSNYAVEDLKHLGMYTQKLNQLLLLFQTTDVVYKPKTSCTDVLIILLLPFGALTMKEFNLRNGFALSDKKRLLKSLWVFFILKRQRTVFCLKLKALCSFKLVFHKTEPRGPREKKKIHLYIWTGWSYRTWSRGVDMKLRCVSCLKHRNIKTIYYIAHLCLYAGEATRTFEIEKYFIFFFSLCQLVR